MLLASPWDSNRAVVEPGRATHLPATAFRRVYIENRRVAGLDPADPIRVDYDQQIGD